MTRSNRSIVYEYVAREAPCTADEVVSALDGELTPQQVYNALSELVTRRGDGGLSRSGRGYYEPRDEEGAPAPEVENKEGEEQVAKLLDELGALSSTTPPAALPVIEHAEVKARTCRLLESILAPSLAARVTQIREDIERIANLQEQP